MDQHYPPTHHSRSTSSLPHHSSSSNTSPASARPTDLSSSQHSLRRGSSENSAAGPPSGNYGNEYTYNGETWMDFLRQTGGSSSANRDTERTYAAFQAAFAPQSKVEGRNARNTSTAEARKRRLTAPESPYRRGSYIPSHSQPGPLVGPSGGPSGPPGSTHGSAPGNPSTSMPDLMPSDNPQIPESHPPSAARRPPMSESRRDSDIVIPKWQPDSDVSSCPVCGMQFSFFYRKHHCRKCGRVVCANCSPHRITIPRQYIVHPPIIDLTGEEDEDMYIRFTSASGLGGGEEVRVCNPCVPDPNYDPPPQIPFSGHYMPGVVQGNSQFGMPLPPLPPPPPPGSRPRNRTFDGLRPHIPPGVPQQPQHRASRSELPSFPRSDIFRDGRVTFNNPGTVNDLFPPPVPHFPNRPGHINPYSYNPQYHQSNHSSYQQRQGSMSTSMPNAFNIEQNPSQGYPHQPPPRRQIPEEDECPICGDELPPKGPDGSENIREAHIQECIQTHFSGGGGISLPSPPAPVEAEASSAPTDVASAPVQTRSRSNTHTPESHRGGREGGEPSRARRMTGNRMLVYKATEKDCVGKENEELECVICFEEFEVGDELGRLECLCKFHKHCIRQWWDTKGVGSCPTHQLHD